MPALSRRPETYPAREARQAAGLTVAQAAKRLRVTPAYLLAKERSGGWCLPLAERGADLYGCRLEDLLFPNPGHGTRERHGGRVGVRNPTRPRRGGSD